MESRSKGQLTAGRLTPTRNGNRLMNAREIASEVLAGKVSPEWVRRNLPQKVTLGHSTVVWFERDVWDWILSRREANAPGAVR